jgi:sterol desaturase/sphingolipid hydroxylase (fatty acid hydroxylase superfamily)
LSTVETPASIRWAEEARKGRRRLYPVTAVYIGLCLTALVMGLRSSRPATALATFVAGLAFWTWVEYLIHRWILHGRFPDGPGFRHVSHFLFDHLHLEHHKRPWDGNHINGTLKDSAWFVLPIFLASLLLPAWSLTCFFAGVIQAGIAEEWVHHSVHFYHFNNLYFRYIKRHHMYHHSPKGDNEGFGLTNGFWDMVYGTRIPAPVRAALYGSLWRGGSTRARPAA